MVSPVMLMLGVVIALLGVAFVLGRRAGGVTRPVVVVVFVVAELWQFVVGAGSSLQLAAPGIGDRALWVPNTLVGVSLSILPLGFLLCLWGTTIGRRLASVCAIVAIVVAAAAAITLSAPPLDPVGVALGFLLLAAPALALLGCAAAMRPAGTVASEA